MENLAAITPFIYPIQIPYKKDIVSSTQFLVLDIYFSYIILHNIYVV